MEQKKIGSADLLVQLASVLEDPTPVALRALRTELEKIEPMSARQVYVINLKAMIISTSIFNNRSSEKSFMLIVATLNEVLKNSFYKKQEESA
jgi:hypothetical protein